MSFIKLENVSKRFQNIKAVDNVSFDISQGEIFGLLGPNGAGKSTLISMMTTLISPDEGDIILGGCNLRGKAVQAKKLLGLVPQEIALYPTLTARENLFFWGKMYGLKGKILSNRVEEALETVGLTQREKGRIDTFSGGMKRRINIAAALLHHPRIMLMDEPTVGIDPQSRSHILDTVLKLNKEGMTVVYTSHYMEEVEFLCTKIAIMDYGKIIALGSKDELRKMISDKDSINIEAYNINSSAEDRLKQLKEIDNVLIDDKIIKVITDDADKTLAKVISILDSEKARIQSINVDEPNLESVFLHLTGRALRD